MDLYLKVTAGILITAILSIVLSKQGADISLLLTICVCCMVILAASVYFKPILDFTDRLVHVGKLNDSLLVLLLKVAGIGLISQIAGFVCTDAGNQSLGKALQIITTAVILCISVPLLEELFRLIEAVLGVI